MVRLAAQTGVAENFEDLGKTPANALPENATVHGRLVPEQSSRLVTGFDRSFGRWNQADRLIFAASVATAAVVAALIVLS